MEYYKNNKQIVNPLRTEDDEVNMYNVICPNCGKSFGIAMAREGMKTPDYCKCPSCQGFAFDITYTRFNAEWRKVRAPHDEIRLTEPQIMGGRESIYSLFSLYPVISGENPVDRVKRIAGYVDEECQDLLQSMPDKRLQLARLVLSKNQNVANILPKIFELYQASEDKSSFERSLLAIKENMTAPQIVEMLGAEAYRKTPALQLRVDEPIGPIKMLEDVARLDIMGMGFMGMEQFQKEGPGQAGQTPVGGGNVSGSTAGGAAGGGNVSGSAAGGAAASGAATSSVKKFCPNCGARCTGKFCPECGTPVNV